MSVEFDWIDLNSDIVNTELHELNRPELSGRVDNSGTGAIMETTSVQRQVAVSTIDGVFGEARVSGDENVFGEGLVDGGNEVDRGSNVGGENLLILCTDDVSEGKQEENDGGEVLPVDRNVGSVVAGNSEEDRLTPVEQFSEVEAELTCMVANIVVSKAEEGVDGIAGIADFQPVCAQEVPGGTDRISLSVDLSPQTGADGKSKPENEIDSQGFLSIAADTTSSAGLDDSFAFCTNGFSVNKREDMLRKEKETEESVHVDKKNVESDAFKSGCYENKCRTENEGDFYTSDLVWGKVKSHPWWPGQIFDRSDASEKAMKYFKKDCFLIAYFGDQTFAWNHAWQIKPFRMHFLQMEKQSNTEAFCHAVGCALDEVSRRVEFGLACPCLSEEIYAKIKYEEIVNAGIREESSRRDAGDIFSGVASFFPTNFVNYLKELASAPFLRTDKLSFVIARAQWLAFNRWKGYNNLSVPEMLDGLIENDADIPVSQNKKSPVEVVDNLVPGVSVVQDDRNFLKRKKISDDGMSPIGKERRLSDLMSRGHSSLPDKKKILKGKASKKTISFPSGKKQKTVNFVSSDFGKKRRTYESSESSVDGMASSSKRLFRFGEHIRMVPDSSPIPKSSNISAQKSVSSTTEKLAVATLGSEKSQKVKVIPAVYLPLDEILSQLYLAAIDPVRTHNFLTPIISFFSDFKNSVCFEKSKLQDTKARQKLSGMQKSRVLPNVEATENSGFEGMEDSYWTDRIIQSISEEKILFEPETAIDKLTPTFELKATADTLSNAVTVPYTEVEKPTSLINEKYEEYSPTALILNFTDLESIPSILNLNGIFSRFGPLDESATEVLNKSKRAKVVFKRRSDAESAFSSAGKFSIFGPALVSYRLNYSHTPCKSSTPSSKQKKKGSTICRRQCSLMNSFGT